MLCPPLECDCQAIISYALLSFFFRALLILQALIYFIKATLQKYTKYKCSVNLTALRKKNLLDFFMGLFFSLSKKKRNRNVKQSELLSTEKEVDML